MGQSTAHRSLVSHEEKSLAQVGDVKALAKAGEITHSASLLEESGKPRRRGKPGKRGKKPARSRGKKPNRGKKASKKGKNPAKAKVTKEKKGKCYQWWRHPECPKPKKEEAVIASNACRSAAQKRRDIDHSTAQNGSAASQAFRREP